jgi:hypothetical protein
MILTFRWLVDLGSAGTSTSWPDAPDVVTLPNKGVVSDKISARIAGRGSQTTPFAEWHPDSLSIIGCDTRRIRPTQLGDGPPFLINVQPQMILLAGFALFSLIACMNDSAETGTGQYLQAAGKLCKQDHLRR